MSAAGKLTAKQQRFVEEYLVDLNATQAAIRSGFSAKNADKIGSQLLGKTRVAEAIAEAQEKRSKRTAITQDMVLKELAKLAFANISDYMRVSEDGLAYTDLSQLTRDQAAAIHEFTIDEYAEGRGEDSREVKRVKLKLADKRQALVDVGRHLGMFVERTHNLNEDISNMTPEQRQARFDELMSKAKGE